MMLKNDIIDYHPQVLHALQNNLPIVALESTIISHGMPYPQNIILAKELENHIKKNHVIPATIAIIKGRIKIGLTEKELEFIAEPDTDIIKISRKDIPYVITTKKNGTTTVASTMFLSSLAGISIFATGGIGGVHRGAETNFDISADLQELHKTNVAVICAGAKSILDLPLTKEYLETLGVPIIGYKTNELPAFFCQNSGVNTDCQLNTPECIAEYLRTKWSLKLQGGVVIAQPIPSQYALNKERIDSIINDAIIEARQKKIKGKKITPFLLKKINILSQGDSLQANIHLVKNNVHLATMIAQSFYLIKE